MQLHDVCCMTAACMPAPHSGDEAPCKVHDGAEYACALLPLVAEELRSQIGQALEDVGAMLQGEVRAFRGCPVYCNMAVWIVSAADDEVASMLVASALQMRMSHERAQMQSKLQCSTSLLCCACCACSW